MSDRKYGQFRPVLDVYIRENFSATLAYRFVPTGLLTGLSTLAYKSVYTCLQVCVYWLVPSGLSTLTYRSVPTGLCLHICLEVCLHLPAGQLFIYKNRSLEFFVCYMIEPSSQYAVYLHIALFD